MQILEVNNSIFLNHFLVFFLHIFKKFGPKIRPQYKYKSSIIKNHKITLKKKKLRIIKLQKKNVFDRVPP